MITRFALPSAALSLNVDADRRQTLGALLGEVPPGVPRTPVDGSIGARAAGGVKRDGPRQNGRVGGSTSELGRTGSRRSGLGFASDRAEDESGHHDDARERRERSR